MTSTRPACASPQVRLALLPGLRAVPREPGILQVGLDQPRRVLLPDRPDVRRLLEALATGAPTTVSSPSAMTALRDLERAGLVLAADSPVGDPPRGRLMSAALARHGSNARTRLCERAASRVFLDGAGGASTEVGRLARLAGLGIATSREQATVVLLLSDGEFSRTRLDDWLRDGIPHLCVQAHDGVVTLGPYVVPGVTACRRCIDAHLGENDPRRPVIVEQLAAMSAREPVDDLLWTLAVSWAIQDLITAAEGGRPSTFSTTIELGPDLEAPRRVWARHPHCGCSWDQWPL